MLQAEAEKDRQAEADAHAATLSEIYAKLEAQKLCTTAAEQGREQAQVSFAAVGVVEKTCPEHPCDVTLYIYTLLCLHESSLLADTRCLAYQDVVFNGKTTAFDAM